VLKTPHVAKALADHLRAVPDLREVLFIAHSLGCRVVVETLELLRQPAASGKNLSVPAICLMAAAVPVSSVTAGAPLEVAAKSALKHYILYSPADHVLKWFFRPGQFFALGNQWTQAVGRFGKPESCWTNNWQNIVNTGLNHGEYYAGRPTLSIFSPSRTAPTLARMFGRALPHYLLEQDLYVVAWPDPTTRNIPEQELPTSDSSQLY
jgi:pimeloyl-ACP methyl ester carboxylesterase